MLRVFLKKVAPPFPLSNSSTACRRKRHQENAHRLEWPAAAIRTADCMDGHGRVSHSDLTWGLQSGKARSRANLDKAILNSRLEGSPVTVRSLARGPSPAYNTVFNMRTHPTRREALAGHGCMPSIKRSCGRYSVKTGARLAAGCNRYSRLTHAVPEEYSSRTQ